VTAGTGEALPGPVACGLLLPELGVLKPAKPRTPDIGPTAWVIEAG